MTYDHFFSAALARLHEERRYRVFADLERVTGRFPHATWHSPDGRCPVVVWCSNDYLGMGQHPKVIGAMVETATRMGAGGERLRMTQSRQFYLTWNFRRATRPLLHRATG